MDEQDQKDQLVQDIMGCEDYEINEQPVWVYELTDRLYSLGWRRGF